MLDLRSVQPLDRSISADPRQRRGWRDRWPVGRKSQKIRFPMIANMLVEYPVQLVQDNGQVLRGWIDLLLETEGDGS